MSKNLRVNRTEELKTPISITLEVFEEIYRLYWSDLFNATYKRVKSVEKSEEIIQDLFTNLWEKKDSITIHGSIAAYLYKSLKFRILNHIRNEMLRAGHHDVIKLNTAYKTNQVEEEIFQKELQYKIAEEVKNLPEKCREVFLLSREDELSFKEISQKLNISVNTVEKHIGKALKSLRTQLKHYSTFFSFALTLLGTLFS